jgi:hypothetical protein
MPAVARKIRRRAACNIGRRALSLDNKLRKKRSTMKTLRLALALGFALAATACTHKQSRPEFETLALDTLVDRGGGQYDIQYRFLSLRDADRSPALQAIEEADIAYFFELEGFTGTAGEAMRTAIAQLTDGSMLADDTEERYSYSVEAEARTVDTLLVYTITRSGYLGGPHDLYDTSTHTYSLAGGYELALGDLFTPQQQERLAELIRERLRERYRVADDEGLAALGFFPEYIRPGENFAPTEEGILFRYAPYEIGDNALGDIEVLVEHAALAGL